MLFTLFKFKCYRPLHCIEVSKCTRLIIYCKKKKILHLIKKDLSKIFAPFLTVFQYFCYFWVSLFASVELLVASFLSLNSRHAHKTQKDLFYKRIVVRCSRLKSSHQSKKEHETYCKKKKIL